MHNLIYFQYHIIFSYYTPNITFSATYIATRRYIVWVFIVRQNLIAKIITEMCMLAEGARVQSWSGVSITWWSTLSNLVFDFYKYKFFKRRRARGRRFRGVHIRCIPKYTVHITGRNYKHLRFIEWILSREPGNRENFLFDYSLTVTYTYCTSRPLALIRLPDDSFIDHDGHRLVEGALSLTE